MMIQPIRNNVLVQCFEGDGVSEGGILVPDSVKEESNKCRIIAVGKGTPKRPMKFYAGQIAHRVKSWGEAVEENGQRYYIMDDKALIALQ